MQRQPIGKIFGTLCMYVLRFNRVRRCKKIMIDWESYNNYPIADPPENCHLNVKKLPENCRFFL